MPSDAKVPAVVLAGGHGDEPVARSLNLPHKALAPIAGQPAVHRVVEALQAARGVEGVVVVTQAEGVAEACPTGVACVEPLGPHFLDTIQAGLAHFPSASYLLLTTSDLPLLTPAAVDDFLEQALDSGADLCYSMVESGQLQGLPGADSRTFVRLREGGFTGGNLVLVSRAFVEQQGERLMQAFAGRKSPVALARMFGLSFIVRLLLGRLGVPDLVKRGGQILHVPIMVVDSTYVELCFDLDEPEQVQYAEEILARR